MNKIFAGGMLALLCLMTSCSALGTNDKKVQQSENLVGNGRDEHGCLSSAGYQWSEARKDCIRVWEEGTKLVHGEDHLFVVFGTDSVKAEIFTGKGKYRLCTRKGQEDRWFSSGEQDWIQIKNGAMETTFAGDTYTEKKE